MNRAELEARIWRNLQVLGADRHDLARHIVDNMLADADAYATSREAHRVQARLIAQHRDVPGEQEQRRQILRDAR